MNRFRRVAPFLILVFLAACTAAQKLPQIREGMTHGQVRSVMGAPDGFARRGRFSAMEYKDRLISGWSWNRTDYGFIFKDGKLIQWGAGRVRQGGPQTLLLYRIN